jgi:hypothetical protein
MPPHAPVCTFIRCNLPVGEMAQQGSAETLQGQASSAETLQDLPNELLTCIAHFFLNVDDCLCLLHLAQTCHGLHALLQRIASQVELRFMRSTGTNTPFATTVAVLNEQGRAPPGARFIRALANCLPTSPTSPKWTVHIESMNAEMLFCLCNTEGVFPMGPNERGPRSLRTFNYDDTAGTLGFSANQPGPIVSTVLQTALEGSPIAALVARVAQEPAESWEQFAPIALSSHLGIKPQYADLWGVAIKRIIADTTHFITGCVNDERHLQLVHTASSPSPFRFSFMVMGAIEPRFQVSTATVTDLGHLTLLDALDFTCDQVHNAVINQLEPQFLVLLPDVCAVERLVFATDAPFMRALTPDGVLHWRYGVSRFGLFGSTDTDYKALIRKANPATLHACAQLFAGGPEDRVRIRGWLSATAGQRIPLT